MIIGLDSATPPTAVQADAARTAGIRMWNGYLQTRPNVGLYHAWSLADFENARRCGGTPVAFCSGWDDPNACRQLAAQWNVRLCLDVESGIRGDGAWVQPWLDASGAGLYGNLAVHTNRRAAFHVLAWYTIDPKATWPAGAVKPAPTGWQFWNTHNEFGVGVDRGYYDDWFLGSNSTATAGSEVRIPQEETMALISGDGKDPRGRAGAIYATNGVIKRYISSPTEVADLLKIFNQADVVKVGQWTVDRMPEVEGAPATSPGGEVLQFSTLKATDTSGLAGKLDAIKAEVDKLQGLLPGV